MESKDDTRLKGDKEALLRCFYYLAQGISQWRDLPGERFGWLQHEMEFLMASAAELCDPKMVFGGRNEAPEILSVIVKTIGTISITQVSEIARYLARMVESYGKPRKGKGPVTDLKVISDDSKVDVGEIDNRVQECVLQNRDAFLKLKEQLDRDWAASDSDKYQGTLRQVSMRYVLVFGESAPVLRLIEVLAGSETLGMAIAETVKRAGISFGVEAFSR